jgi:nitrate reductase NapE
MGSRSDMRVAGDRASPETRPTGNQPTLDGKRGEQVVFAILAVLIWPVIAVAVVGGYGLLVWMYQLIAGPPGPPGA